jgi:hypothetical protein
MNKPNQNLEDKEGWLTPGAEFIFCPHGMHETWANLQDTTTRELEAKGWVQIVLLPTANPYLCAMTMCKRPTTLNHLQAEWCAKNGIDYDAQYIRG